MVQDVAGAGAGAGAGEDQSKIADLREQILQLAGHACHDEEEKLRTELLEKLNICKRDTLIELCRSFDIIGSRANRKEELVSFLMKFVQEQSSGIDGTNPDKKIKKRRRMKEEANLSSSKPLEKKKKESTALETQGEEEADGRKGGEDRTQYPECVLKDNRYVCADNKKGKFPNEEANVEHSERINGSISENLDAVALNEVSVPTKLALTTTPSAKLVTFAEGDSTDMKALKKKSSISKKKANPKEDHKVKSCGKQGSGGDAKPRKQSMKPSRDELREAVFLILETADFATMTFGDVVKQVDKYFGKDLFERKPLIRSLIEEELFRLSEEADKEELEEEEAAEAKARAEQTAKEMVQVRTVESGMEKRTELPAGGDGKTEDCAKNRNCNINEKSVKGGTCIVSADNGNSRDAPLQGSENSLPDADTTNGYYCDEFMDGKCGKAATNVNIDDVVQGSRNGKTEKVKKNNVNTLEGFEGGKTDEAGNGENDGTENGRTEEGSSGTGDNNAEYVNGCEAEESNSRGNDECVERAEHDEAQKSDNSENSGSVVIDVDKDGKAIEGNMNTEKGPTDAGGDGEAEDAEHNTNTKVDLDSGKNGAADNGKAGHDAKADSDDIA